MCLASWSVPGPGNEQTKYAQRVQWVSARDRHRGDLSNRQPIFWSSSVTSVAQSLLVGTIFISLLGGKHGPLACLESCADSMECLAPETRLMFMYPFLLLRPPYWEYLFPRSSQGLECQAVCTYAGSILRSPTTPTCAHESRMGIILGDNVELEFNMSSYVLFGKGVIPSAHLNQIPHPSSPVVKSPRPVRTEPANPLRRISYRISEPFRSSTS